MPFAEPALAPANAVARSLRAHAVRLTPGRQLVLEALLRTNFALSSSEIEQQITGALDRTTMFRNLCLLEQKGLIHRVVDYSETVRFAVAPGLRSPEAAVLPAEHVHFKCLACQHIYCLPQVPVPAVRGLGDHQVVRRDFLLSGVCERCRTKAGC